MSAPESVQPGPSRSGSRRRAACFLALLAAVTGPLAGTALAWSDRGHRLIVEEAVARLPDPLGGLLGSPAHLERWTGAAPAPPGQAEDEPPPCRPEQQPRRFFLIDAVAEAPYPFKSFPRRRPAAEKAFGAKALRAAGTAPWAAADALDRLAEALAERRADAVFEAAGNLARYAAGLHMPLHTTKNWDGRLSGNHGVHEAVETGLVHRHLAFYRGAVREDRRVVHYVREPADRLFDWLIAAHGRAGPILEADSVARRQSKYNPAQHPEDAADLDAARPRPYYETLKKELARRNSPVAAAMRDAAAHLADLLYTAWVQAGKPASLGAPADREPEDTPPYWLLAVAVGLVILLLWPRRRRATGTGDAPSGPDSR